MTYALLLGAAEGYDYATTSPRFEVRGLIYTATAHVDDGRVRELMQLTPGTNILSLDLDQLASRIAADAWVAKATVVRVLPDSLEVEVTEHEPAAVLMADDPFLINQEGLPFKRLDPGERRELPVITGLGRMDLLGDPTGARERIDRGLDAFNTYQQKRRPRLSEINVDDTGAVTLYTAELGSQLRVGRGDVAPALKRYDALRAALGEESDKLAVAHLDAAFAPEGRDRVVASFFPTKDAPSLLVEAQAQAAHRVEARAASLEDDRVAAARGAKRQGKKRNKKIPRYE